MITNKDIYSIFGKRSGGIDTSALFSDQQTANNAESELAEMLGQTQSTSTDNSLNSILASFGGSNKYSSKTLEEELGITTPETTQKKLEAEQEKTAEKQAQLAEKGGDTTLDKAKSAFSRLFSILDAAGAPTRAVLHNLTNGSDDADVSAWQQFKNALAGRETLSGSDIMSDWGIKNKWGKLAGGIAIDVLADPLTYVSGGLSTAGKARLTTKVADIAKDVSKGIDAAELAAKYGDDVARLLDGAENIGDVSKDAGREILSLLKKQSAKELGQSAGIRLGKLEMPGSRALLDKLSNAGLELKRTNVGKMVDGAVGSGAYSELNSLNDLVPIATKEARRAASAGKRAASALGSTAKNEVLDLIPDEGLRKATSIAIGNQVKKAGDIIAEGTQKRAKFSADTSALKSTLEQYLKSRPDLTSDDLDNALKAAEGVKNTFEQSRQTLKNAGKDVKALLGEEYGSTGYLPGRAKLPNETDQSVLDALGIDVNVFDLRAPKELATKQQSKAYDTIKERLVNGGIMTDLDLADLAGAKTEKDYAGIALQKFKNDMNSIAGDGVNSEVVQRLAAQLEQPFTNNTAFKEVLSSYDKLTSWWKKQATTLNFPRFQNRNLLSNKFLQASEGLLNPKTEIQSSQFIANTFKTLKNGGSLNYLKEGDASLFKEMLDNSVIQVNNDVLELIPGLADVKAGRLSTAANKVSDMLKSNKATDMARKALNGDYSSFVNELYENQSRIASYMAAKAKGMSGEEAARMVDTALYNYSPEMLTSFENNIVKRAIPFYTWMRRNTPHSFQLLMQKPRALTIPTKVRDDLNKSNGIDTSLLPEYLQDSGVISLGQTDADGNKVVYKADSLLPIAELQELVNAIPTGDDTATDSLQQLARFGMQSLTPAVKVPYDIQANTNSYYGTQIKQREGQKTKAPSYVNVLAKMLAPVMGDYNEKTGNYFDVDENGDIQYKIDPVTAYALKNVSPFANSLGDLTDESSQQKNKQLGYALGLRPYSMNEQSLALDKQESINDMLNNRLNAIKKKEDAAARIKYILQKKGGN